MITKQDFNVIILQEIGLEVDKDGIVSDQDTGTKLEYNKKKLTLSNNKEVKHLNTEFVEFNPIDNPQLMNSLFDYYLNKINREDDRYIGMYHSSTNDKTKKGHIELKEGDSSIKSGDFYNDSLKYGDLILKLNESPVNIDLEALDKEPIKKKLAK